MLQKTFRMTNPCFRFCDRLNSNKKLIMEVLDRKAAPAFGKIDKIDFIKASSRKLGNGIPVYSVSSGTQEIIKIELVFSAGIKYQHKPLVAATVNNNLAEGSSKYTAAQLADKVDYYGAFFDSDIDPDYSSLNLYTLNKHIANTLPTIEEILKQPVFPQGEMQTYLDNKRSKFQVNSKKVSNVARKKFNELLFGEKHPYGYNLKIEDYDHVDRNDVIEFYKKYYTASNCTIILSGKVNEDVFGLLEKHFGGNDWKNDSVIKYEPSTGGSAKEKKNLIHKEEAVQSAIRIGKLLFNKTHPDFPAMQVLNTVLGGYFGSRLMSNIREDKGYTYGIGSGVVSLRDAGWFFIATEVGVDVCSNALKEIYFEIKKLRTELIPEEELKLVKNYLLGVFLRSVDGPFAMADKFKSIHLYGLGYDYLERYINTVRSITSAELLALAQKYLNEEEMMELVVGRKS